MNQRAVEILDTTLRDGNKLSFVVLDRHDRLVIARQLAALGVDVIDAGYPAASKEERESVELIAKEVRGPAVAALCRATQDDVAATVEILRGAARPRLHLFMHASPGFLKEVLGVDSAGALRLIAACLDSSPREGIELQFSFGEIGQADRGFLLEGIQAAAEHGARVVNLADTNGCLHPREVGELVAAAVEAVADREGVIIGVHMHNDLGLATAGSLTAIEAGARHVEATIGGIGTRSGNAALEEVVFALEAFRPTLGLGHHVRLNQLAPTCDLLARLTGLSPHPNKPVLGKYAFQEARAPEIRRTLTPELRELLRDETVGRTPEMIFSEHEISQAGFEQELSLLGVDAETVNLDKAYSLFQSQMRRKKSVFTSELREMLDEARVQEPPLYELSAFSVMTGSNTLPLGSVELRKRGAETREGGVETLMAGAKETGTGGTMLVQSSHGSGPVDALYRAVDRAVGLKPRLLMYSVDSLTEGKDARAVVTVSLGYLSRRFHGHSGSTDLIEASLRAYLDAVNGIERFRKESPEEEFYIDGEQLWWE